MGLALSTSWNAYRHNKGIALIREIKELGFNEVELSFNLTGEIVSDIHKAVSRKEVRVTALHNYCPIPGGFSRSAGLPDCLSLAAADENERLNAVKYSQRTIEAAARLNAKAVILHCGRVEIFDFTRKLMSLYEAGTLAAAEGKKLKAQIQKERLGSIKPHFAAALKSLDVLARCAAKLKVKLGIENRFYFREIPSFEEIGDILKYFKDAQIYYWHDTGHAQLWQNLGFIKHEDYLKRYSGRLLGIHLHDIEGAKDHLAPLKGNLDFGMLKKYIKPDTLLTIEAHHPATAEDIVSAKKYLEGLFFKNGPN